MLIGQILISEGFCTEIDILNALDKQRAGDKRPIGEILVEMGIISEAELAMVLRLQKEGRDRAFY